MSKNSSNLAFNFSEVKKRITNQQNYANDEIDLLLAAKLPKNAIAMPIEFTKNQQATKQKFENILNAFKESQKKDLVGNIFSDDILDLKQFSKSAKKDNPIEQLVIPIQTGEGHFTALHIKRIVDENGIASFKTSYVDPIGVRAFKTSKESLEKAQIAEPTIFQSAYNYFFPTPTKPIEKPIKQPSLIKKSSIPNHIVEVLKECLEIEPEQILISTTQIQDTEVKLDPNLGPKKQATNNHSGAFATEALLALSREDWKILEDGKIGYKDSNNNNYLPLPNNKLDKDKSNEYGLGLREIHLKNLQKLEEQKSEPAQTKNKNPKSKASSPVNPSQLLLGALALGSLGVVAVNAMSTRQSPQSNFRGLSINSSKPWNQGNQGLQVGLPVADFKSSVQNSNKDVKAIFPPTKAPVRASARPTTLAPTSLFPSSQPSKQPNADPSSSPTNQAKNPPSNQPTKQPAKNPSNQPSKNPSNQPSKIPSSRPTSSPSSDPTRNPSKKPSNQPSKNPSSQPALSPSSDPTRSPSNHPTKQPAKNPSNQPSKIPSSQPALSPSSDPTRSPSNHPTKQPAKNPSNQPSKIPSSRPSKIPSSRPATDPTRHPSLQTTRRPSSHPSLAPSFKPSAVPSKQPSHQPVAKPNSKPSKSPSNQPVAGPTRIPTKSPYFKPSSQPTKQLVPAPTRNPTKSPSLNPSKQPSKKPLSSPKRQPSLQPSKQVANSPSSQPGANPSSSPSGQEVENPSSQPSEKPNVGRKTTLIEKPINQPNSVQSEPYLLDTIAGVIGASGTLMGAAATLTIPEFLAGMGFAESLSALGTFSLGTAAASSIPLIAGAVAGIYAYKMAYSQLESNQSEPASSPIFAPSNETSNSQSINGNSSPNSDRRPDSQSSSDPLQTTFAALMLLGSIAAMHYINKSRINQRRSTPEGIAATIINLMHQKKVLDIIGALKDEEPEHKEGERKEESPEEMKKALIEALLKARKLVPIEGGEEKDEKKDDDVEVGQQNVSEGGDEEKDEKEEEKKDDDVEVGQQNVSEGGGKIEELSRVLMASARENYSFKKFAFIYKNFFGLDTDNLAEDLAKFIQSEYLEKIIEALEKINRFTENGSSNEQAVFFVNPQINTNETNQGAGSINAGSISVFVGRDVITEDIYPCNEGLSEQSNPLSQSNRPSKKTTSPKVSKLASKTENKNNGQCLVC